ncbi:MAG: phosphonate C-P lyase system protein PhnG [Microbacteriaceae bacterium]|nr:phosphonate C-P lyase system protein PhnG [Microbacteriaceae bacterium]
MGGTTVDEAERGALRRRAARAFSNAPRAALAEHWLAWADRPGVEVLRGPEPGLVMVQGRIGGTGDRFNLGEATVTRATVRLSGGALAAPSIGTAYVLGSDVEHAGLAAIFTALLADEATHDTVIAEVVEPLEAALADRDRAVRTAARTTVVDFFTVARENAGALASDEDDE